MNSILQALLLVFIFLNKINCECGKDSPILKGNECKNTYCKENEFWDGTCLIDNPIVKLQWINYIIQIGKETPSFFLPIKLSQENIIFISFEEDIIHTYRLNDELNNNDNKYKNYTISHLNFLSGLSLNFNETNYPLICDVNICSIIYFDLDMYISREYSEVCQFTINSGNWPYFQMLNMNEENKILFTTVSSDSIYLSLNEITEKQLSIIRHINISHYEENIKSQQLSCYITENKYIICLYFIRNKHKISVYDSSLNNLATKNISNNIELSISSFENTFYAIHLKQEIGVITYYIKNVGNLESPLYMEVIEFNPKNKTFVNIVEKYLISLDNQTFSDHDGAIGFTYEHLIKITDDKFSYAYYDDNENRIILVLFDLYGNNLLARYYIINHRLYAFTSTESLHLFVYKSFLGIGFYSFLTDIKKYKSLIIIFGYNNNDNIELNLDIYKDNQGIILNINTYFSVKNNLFGYELLLKIISISNGLNGLKCFSINNKKEIQIGEMVYSNDSILFDVSSCNITFNEKYYINISIITREPDFDLYSSLYDKIDEIGNININDYYEKKIIDEKNYRFNLNFMCYEKSNKCKYDILSIKTLINNLVSLSDYVPKDNSNANLFTEYLNIISNKSNYSNNCNEEIIDNFYLNNSCVKECPYNYKNDSQNNCILQKIYLFNNETNYEDCPKGTRIDTFKEFTYFCKCESLYYIDNNSNQICLSNSTCPELYPILIEETNECINDIKETSLITDIADRKELENETEKLNDKYISECQKNTCIYQNEGIPDICLEQNENIEIFNQICFYNYSNVILNLKEITANNIKISYDMGITISGYNLNDDYFSDFESIVENNNNLTLIDIRECISLYKNAYNISDDANIYIVIIDTPYKYSNETTNRFNFELYFENLTKIDNLDICKNIKIKIYSPITNDKNIDYNLINYFNQQGEYDIFNKNDKFYRDICSKASINNNDLTLNDRYLDIYPHEVNICPKNCEYLGMNITSNRVVCDCSINTGDYEYELMTKEGIIKFFKNFNNLIHYFDDMINYKIIKCYHLFKKPDNYMNICFFIGTTLFMVSFILLLIFRFRGFKKLRLVFYKDLEEKKLINNISNNQKVNLNKVMNYNEISNKWNNNLMNIKKKNSTKRQITDDSISNSNVKINLLASNQINIYKKDKQHQNKNSIDIPQKENDDKEIKGSIQEKEIKDKDNNIILFKYNNKEEIDINELSYYKAKVEDRRAFPIIFISFLQIKIELIYIIFKLKKYSNKFLIFSVYLKSYSIDLLLNSLLYNEFTISQKYHNNGHLKLITSLIIALLSNLINSIIFRVISLLVNYPNLVEGIINEIKEEQQYIYMVRKIFRIMTFKFIMLLVFELLSGIFMIYYLFIFGAIYSKSIYSFFLNYLYSQLESLLYSFCISLLICTLRKISINYDIKRFYIISQYLNEYF